MAAVPAKVSWPVPALISVPGPLITPLKVVDVLLPPAVSVVVFPKVTLPAPAREPIVSLTPIVVPVR